MFQCVGNPKFPIADMYAFWGAKELYIYCDVWKISLNIDKKLVYISLVVDWESVMTITNDRNCQRWKTANYNKIQTDFFNMVEQRNIFFKTGELKTTPWKQQKNEITLLWGDSG